MHIMSQLFCKLSKGLALGGILGSLFLMCPPSLSAEIESQPTILPESINAEEIRLEVSLSHRQVTVYRRLTEMKSYQVAIGKPGWETPTGTFRITQKVENPTWINPITDDVIIPGDPENPLGHYWIGFWTQGWIWFGFHGTNEPESVGQAVTHGCLRMHNEDVEELFSQVKVGTLVTVVQ